MLLVLMWMQQHDTDQKNTYLISEQMMFLSRAIEILFLYKFLKQFLKNSRSSFKTLISLLNSSKIRGLSLRQCFLSIRFPQFVLKLYSLYFFSQWNSSNLASSCAQAAKSSGPGKSQSCWRLSAESCILFILGKRARTASAPPALLHPSHLLPLMPPIPHPPDHGHGLLHHNKLNDPARMCAKMCTQTIKYKPQARAALLT